MGTPIFDLKYRQGPSQNGMLSEQDDIDSDFIPATSSHTMISVELLDGENIEEESYYNSDDESRKHREITHVNDRTNHNCCDSLEHASDSEMEEEEDCSDDDEDKDPHQYKHEGFGPELNSVKPRKSEKTDKKENNEVKKKKRGFFGKLFARLKASPRGKKKIVAQQKKSNSYLSHVDIEQPEDASLDLDYDISTADVTSVSYSRSQRTHYALDGSESEASSQASAILSQQPRRSLTKDRRISFESALPGVVEEMEAEEELTEEYRMHHDSMGINIDEHADRRIEKKAPEESKDSRDNSPPKIDLETDSERDVSARTPPDAREETPDPISNKPKKQKADESLKSPKRSKTKKSKKKSKKEKKKKKKAHASALAGMNHSASSRIDFAGQIDMANLPIHIEEALKATEELETEVHRLSTLVGLMMTRMELYERQAECLIETSLEHDREWKKATIEHFTEASKKRKELSEVEERLNGIKSLLAERNAQDKWIRKLELIQRGYVQCLATTQNQLKNVRYEHVLTNKQILDFKKSGTGSPTGSAHTPDILIEDITRSTKNSGVLIYNETTTPIIANGTARMKRRVEPTAERRGSILVREALDATNNTALATSQGLEQARTKEPTSLLGQMIVSWHQDDDNVSLLSDLGTNTARKKAIEKRKLRKKKKQQESVSTSLNTR